MPSSAGSQDTAAEARSTHSWRKTHFCLLQNAFYKGVVRVSAIEPQLLTTRCQGYQSCRIQLELPGFRLLPGTSSWHLGLSALGVPHMRLLWEAVPASLGEGHILWHIAQHCSYFGYNWVTPNSCGIALPPLQTDLRGCVTSSSRSSCCWPQFGATPGRPQGDAAAAHLYAFGADAHPMLIFLKHQPTSTIFSGFSSQS